MAEEEIPQKFNDTTKDISYAILTKLGGSMADIEEKYKSTEDDLLYAIWKKIGTGNGGGGGGGTGAANDWFPSFVSVKDIRFGAIGNGVANDAPAIQAACDYAIANKIQNVYFPAGRYKTTAPIILHNYKDGYYNFFTVKLIGEQSFWGADARSEIYYTGNNFAIGIQQGKGCKIYNLQITGMFQPPNLSDYQFFNITAAQFTDGTSRQSRYSPQAGICVDPFAWNVPPDGGYPGLTAWYKGPVGNGGSTGTEVQDCFIANFIVGFITSPNGSTQNAEIQLLDKVQFQNVKYCIAGCQNQEKANQATNLHCWGECYCVYTNKAFGDTSAGNIFMQYCNFAGRVNRLVDAQKNGWFSSTFSYIYAEFLGQTGLSEGNYFDKCFFEFVYPSIGGFQILFNGQPGRGSTFRDCVFRYYGIVVGKMLCRGTNSFFNCEFSGTPISSQLLIGENDENLFQDCIYQNYNGEAFKLSKDCKGIGFMYGRKNTIRAEKQFDAGLRQVTFGENGTITVPNTGLGFEEGYFTLNQMVGINIDSHIYWGIVTAYNSPGNITISQFAFNTVPANNYHVLIGCNDYVYCGRVAGNFVTGDNKMTDLIFDSQKSIPLHYWTGKLIDNPYCNNLTRLYVNPEETIIYFNHYVEHDISSGVLNNGITEKFYYNNEAAWQDAENDNKFLGFGDEIYISENSELEIRYRVTQTGFKENAPVAVLTPF